MSKTMILTATLPFEAYKEYERKVHYDYDSSYDDEEEEEAGCLEPMQNVLYSIIEGDDEVWELLMKDAYYEPYVGNATHRSSWITERITKSIDDSSYLTDVKSIDVDVDIAKFTIQLTIGFANEFDELDNSILQELLNILARDGFYKLCDQTVYYFNLEDFTDAIYECDVELELFDQINTSDLEYTIEYK